MTLPASGSTSGSIRRSRKTPWAVGVASLGWTLRHSTPKRWILRLPDRHTKGRVRVWLRGERRWIALARTRAAADRVGRPTRALLRRGRWRAHELDGKFYRMVGDYADINCGMYTLVARRSRRSLPPGVENFGLLRNRTRMHVYFSRFLDTPNGSRKPPHARRRKVLRRALRRLRRAAQASSDHR